MHPRYIQQQKDKEAKLSQFLLPDLVIYSPKTGIFRWIPQPHWKPHTVTRLTSRPAGCKGIQGYINLKIPINGEKIDFRASRLAFLYMLGRWPVGLVEHKNRDPSDNRWTNLREVTYQENMLNTGVTVKARHGYKGVSKSGKKGFTATLRHEGVLYSIHGFQTALEAAEAYDQAALCFRGDKAILNFPSLNDQYLALIAKNGYRNEPARKPTSALAGVSLHAETGLWRARWKAITISYHKTPEEAHQVYLKAKRVIEQTGVTVTKVAELRDLMEKY